MARSSGKVKGYDFHIGHVELLHARSVMVVNPGPI